MSEILDEFVTLVAKRVVEELRATPVQTEESGPELTTLEAAGRLAVHPDTLRDWAKAGCPHTRIGNSRIRWQLNQVKAWLSAREAAQ